MNNMARLVKMVMSILIVTLALIVPVEAFAVESEPELTEAQAAIVCDQAGNVLYSKDPQGTYPMASITKIMTAMVAIDSGVPLDTICSITVEELYWNSQEIGYVETDTPTLYELLLSTLVYSGNDAALNVALNVSGTEQAFVDKMNAKASELGMNHTHFVNPHGLEADGHYSCVEDLVIMGRYAMEHYPLIAQIVRIRSITIMVNGEEETYESTDELMEVYEGLLGIKTGGVESGTAFLGASARDGVTLYTAVLGCSTGWGRFEDTMRLMDWAYAKFRTKPIAAPTWSIAISPYALGFSQKCIVSMPEGQSLRLWPGESLSYRTVLNNPRLMVESGDPIGASWWRQSGRFAGAGTYVAREPMAGVPGVNVFELPLFS